ncbi:MAG: RluA family pseudouridine synthase [Sulfurospirillaceae bacterium]|nr:RluA family pseudouridine synthase [Sulfurospirillaceae bacterium]MDD3462907.1 RluA family pseudouridine synthase [Sulfurospirillaceae bacterium]
MKLEKAYKLLALQEDISNRTAKDLIDRGVVYSNGKKVVVARGEMSVDSKFKIEKIEKIRVLFEDDKIMAVDKPAFVTSEEVSKEKGYPLVHRLDRETSGVLILSKDEAFRKKAVEAFKAREVKKEYIAVVEGRLIEDIVINSPILTVKKGNVAHSRISDLGKEAISRVEPLMYESKKSKIKITIDTGRTHQIRVHLKSIAAPIQGDVQYGGRPFKRMMLHAQRIVFMGYNIVSGEPDDFKKFASIS